MSETVQAQPLPTTGFVRLAQILGDPRGKPPLAGVIPIRKSAWWVGVKSGKYPAPIKLGRNTTAWRAEDIHALIARLGTQSPSHGTLGAELTLARQSKRERKEKRVRREARQERRRTRSRKA